jgi:tripartite-type tricarboxylate transporter receptor subunit TctC
MIKFLLCALMLFHSLSFATTTLIVPAAPGGVINRYAIEMQTVLSEILNDIVVLEFKPGAQGYVAAKSLSERTTTTFLLGAAQEWKDLSIDINGFNQLKSIKPVAFMGTIPGAVVSKPNRFNNLRQAITHSKTTPLTYGIPGSSANLNLFRNMSNKYATPQNFKEIPFRTGTDVVVNVLGGHVDIGMTVVDGVVSHIHEGKLVGLAVYSGARSKLLPDIPTMIELGLETENEFKYYNNIFLWTNNQTEDNATQTIRQALVKYFSTENGKIMMNKLDVQFNRNSISEPESYLKRIIH